MSSHLVPLAHVIAEVIFHCSVFGSEDLPLVTQSRVRITHRGAVTWSPGLRWKTACAIDLTYFPFDTQICGVYFVNWMYGPDFIEFVAGSNKVSTFSMVKSEQWKLLDTHVDDSDLTFPVELFNASKAVILPTIRFTLLLQREPNYYIFNILLPSTTISFVSSFMFLLPVESGEKASFAITTLLSYTVILVMVMDIIPTGGRVLSVLSTQHL